MQEREPVGRRPILERAQQYSERHLETLLRPFNEGRHGSAVIDAALELSDNALDHREKKVPGHLTNLSININEAWIRFTNLGGRGGDGEDILDSLDIGTSRERGLGVAGFGMKGAVMILGTGVEIQAKPPGDGPYYTVKIPDYAAHFKSGTRTKVFDEERIDLPVDRLLGLWDVKIPGTKDGVVRQFQTHGYDQLLGEIYRPVLTVNPEDANIGRRVYDDQGNVITVYDYLRINLVLGPKRLKTNKIAPMEIPLASRYAEAGYSDRFEDMAHLDIYLKIDATDKQPAYETKHHVWGWVGVVDEENKASSKVKRGIRFYYKGRRIKMGTTTADMGLDLKEDGLANLTGEFYLDNITELPNYFQSNKSMEINSNHPVWKQIKDQIADIDKVKRLREVLIQERKSRPKIERTEKMRYCADFVRQVANMILPDLVERGIINLEDLMGDKKGIIVADPLPPPPDRGGTKSHRSRRRKKPTPRPGPVDEDKSKRMSIFSHISWEPLGGERRWAYVNDSVTGRTLQINTDHPQFQEELKTEGNLRDFTKFLTEVVADFVAESVGKREDGTIDHEKYRKARDAWVYFAYQSMRAMDEWTDMQADAGNAAAERRMAARAAQRRA